MSSLGDQPAKSVIGLDAQPPKIGQFWSAMVFDANRSLPKVSASPTRQWMKVMSDAIGPGHRIREARERKGLDEGQCGDEVGLSAFCMYDVEADATEFFDNISLGTARRICELLDLDLLDLVARFFPVEILERAPLSNAEFFGRDRLIAERRRAKGLSEEALGDIIGFESVTVSSLERTPDFIESLPIRTVVEVAGAIGIDPGKLLGGAAQSV